SRPARASARRISRVPRPWSPVPTRTILSAGMAASPLGRSLFALALLLQPVVALGDLSLGLEHGRDRLQEDQQVGAEGQAGDVLVVGADAAPPVDGVAAVHLRPARHARADEQAAALCLVVLLDLVAQSRTGPHQAHV